MRPRLQLRAMSAAEVTQIEQLARSRTAAARLVDRPRSFAWSTKGAAWRRSASA
jgi:hypothetical protein